MREVDWPLAKKLEMGFLRNKALGIISYSSCSPGKTLPVTEFNLVFF